MRFSVRQRSEKKEELYLVKYYKKDHFEEMRESERMDFSPSLLRPTWNACHVINVAEM